MKLKRDKIKDFDIPDNYLAEMLDFLEEGLKDVETDLDDEVVYTVINNIIEFKFEKGGAYKRAKDTKFEKHNKEFLPELTKRVLKKDNKIKFWYNYEELYERVTGKKLRSGFIE